MLLEMVLTHIGNRVGDLDHRPGTSRWRDSEYDLLHICNMYYTLATSIYTSYRLRMKRTNAMRLPVSRYSAAAERHRRLQSPHECSSERYKSVSEKPSRLPPRPCKQHCGKHIPFAHYARRFSTPYTFFH